MPQQVDPDQTLPSVVASPARAGQQKELTLTIVFHPDTSRIGESAQFEKFPGESSRILGRQTPDFKRRGEKAPAQPLDELYVSKEALRIHYIHGAVIVEKDSSSSRAQVDGRELSGKMRLSSAQLGVGVPIVMGGRVVLLLRRTAPFNSFGGYSQSCDAMLGSSAYMDKLKEQISLLAKTNLDVLIRGETGTGKELVADAVHGASDQASKTMIAVNMAAIPATLAPTLLFGGAKGAFTGADKATAGYFGQAEGGTLFLDEIGDTPPEVQAQLLRALQQREVQVVGGPVRKVNLRIISATDAQLDDRACNFKAALRHRLAESEIVLLPLRQHPEDIGELLFIFLKNSMSALGCGHVLPGCGARANEIAMWAELFNQFVMYSWPGNIRELSNYAQQVALASEVSAVIPDTIFVRLSESNTVVCADNPPKGEACGAKPDDYSEQEFLEGYKKARYEVLRTARQMGISRQAVYRRIFESPKLCLANELSDEQIRVALANYGDDLTATAMQLKVSRTALRERIRRVLPAGTE